MERTIECELTGGIDGVGLAIMHLIWGHQADPDVMMILVVPIEEASAEASGVLDAAEALGEPWLIFQGLEVAFGEWVVVRCVWPMCERVDAEISEQAARWPWPSSVRHGRRMQRTGQAAHHVS